MKLLLLLLFITVFNVSMYSQDYKKASNETNEKAKLLVTECLNKKDASGIFDKTIICGPNLWELLVKEGVSKKITGIETTFHVPVNNDFTKKPGRVIQALNELNVVWNYLMSFEKNQPVVRRPTKSELQYYAAILSPVIEEPIFVIELNNKKVLLDISKKNDSILFIDLL